MRNSPKRDQRFPAHMQPQLANSTASPWPHRWAVALVCATFPLLWVGGLVTTTDAGMAVPDWPNTFGYNLFLYPWQTWLAGPWDVFVEHGHRMLGAAVGMITIVLLALLWRHESRRWVRYLAVVALGLVVFQGVLGGMRVLLDERTLAMLHGCTGPLFFAVAVALACVTSQTWTRTDAASEPVHHASLIMLAVVTCILAYLQIILGAVMRHAPVATQPTAFAVAVRFHLFLAAMLTVHALWLVAAVFRKARRRLSLRRLACGLAILIFIQLALGAATWAVKFAVPTWAAAWISLGESAVKEGGWQQTHVVTAHVATGSLILATLTALMLYSMRLLSGSPAALCERPKGVARWEGAA